MPSGIHFIEELAEVRICPNGVRLLAVSGSETYDFCFERSLWRRFLEREITRLAEFDRAERAKVVALKGRQRKH